MTLWRGRWNGCTGFALGMMCLAALTACVPNANLSIEGAPANASDGAGGAVYSSGSLSVDSTETDAAAPPEALAVYDAMWEDIMVVSQTSDDTSAQLALHMSGQPLRFWAMSVSRDHSNGRVERGNLSWHAKVTLATPTRVEVTDCVDTTQWVNVTLDGKPSGGTPGGRHRSTAAITKAVDGSWHVSEQHIGDVGTC
jgi:hypothetical protein